MKILWLSNKVLSLQDRGATGTWLDAMAQGLCGTDSIQLGNITTGNVKRVTRQDCGAISQWVVPVSSKLDHTGLPSKKIVLDIIQAVEEFSPESVHIWGTESFWGLLTARKLIKQKSLLEMQGLKYAIAKVFHGWLSIQEQVACVGLKEILRISTIWHRRRRFSSWGVFEKEIINQHQNIVVQSKWIEAQVKAINRNCTIFESDLLLRDPFYSAEPWQYLGKHQIFCSAAYSSPFKGLHIAIRSIAILKNRFPNIVLRIAGAHHRSGLRQDGYVAWIVREVGRLGLDANVKWLGPLNALQVVSEMRTSSAMVIPSFIENCSTSMQEAMLVGTPVVATYTGGLPSLAKDGESALFFPLGDEAMCAYQLYRILTDLDLSTQLAQQSRDRALERNNRERIIKNQLNSYRLVLAQNMDTNNLKDA